MSSRKKKADQDDLNFESTMKSIEILLEKLENDETSLDESLQLFEDGIKLIRGAQDKLAKAEQRVQILLQDKDEPELEDFELHDGDS